MVCEGVARVYQSLHTSFYIVKKVSRQRRGACQMDMMAGAMMSPMSGEVPSFASGGVCG